MCSQCICRHLTAFLFLFFSDIAAETIAKGKLAASLDQPQSWQYVFRIRSVDIFVRAVLRHLYDWPIEVALLALYQCLERMDRPHPFLDGIERLYSRILVYQKVSNMLDRT